MSGKVKEPAPAQACSASRPMPPPRHAPAFPPDAESRAESEKEPWEGQIQTVRCADGRGRALSLRARRATPEEFRRANERVNRDHAEDLQALADL